MCTSAGGRVQLYKERRGEESTEDWVLMGVQGETRPEPTVLCVFIRGVEELVFSPSVCGFVSSAGEQTEHDFSL